MLDTAQSCVGPLTVEREGRTAVATKTNGFIFLGVDLDVVPYAYFTRLESIAIKIDKSATEAHERNSN